MMKRKHTDFNAEATLYNKRSRPNEEVANDDSPNPVQPKLDLTYGQRSAFPGLDEHEGEDGLFYGPASDGLEYLRMVR